MTFVAAGNDRKNLDYECDIFPACYTFANVYPVGALDPVFGEHANVSNHGRRIKLWFDGSVAKGFREENPATSYATPRALSEFIYRLSIIERFGT
jgi:hypothetical protein